MIELKHITKVFPTADGELTALNDVNITIHDGDVYGIVGMSGAGKSTLVRCINLLERPTSGQVVIDGKDLCVMPAKELIQQRRSISMIFQQFNLLMQRTCLKNICFPMEIAGVKAADAQKKAKELLEIVGLPDKADAYPAQLSGGQKQRIAIAGVLAMKPECIVLDEATAMLDPIGRREVLAAVEKLNREQGITVVLITHHMNEAEHADRVIVMNDGLVVMDGKPREVFTRKKELEDIGLAVPDTVSLLFSLREAGMDVPVDAITVEECADAIAKNFT